MSSPSVLSDLDLKKKKKVFSEDLSSQVVFLLHNVTVWSDQKA